MTPTKHRHKNGTNYQPLFGPGTSSSTKGKAGGRKILLLVLAKQITTYRILLEILYLIRMAASNRILETFDIKVVEGQDEFLVQASGYGKYLTTNGCLSTTVRFRSGMHILTLTAKHHGILSPTEHQLVFWVIKL